MSTIVQPGQPASQRMDGAPFILRLQQWLMILFRMTEAEAWDYPLGLAIMRWETYWEQEGRMSIYSYLEAEADRYAAEQDALEAKNGDVPCRR